MTLLEDGDGLSIDDKLPLLSLDCAFELAMSGITLEHVDHVVEVNEEGTDDDNIHFARVKSCAVTRCPIWPNPFTVTFTAVSQVVAGAEQEDTAVCPTGGAESCNLLFSFNAMFWRSFHNNPDKK